MFKFVLNTINEIKSMFLRNTKIYYHVDISEQFFANIEKEKKSYI